MIFIPLPSVEFDPDSPLFKRYQRELIQLAYTHDRNEFAETFLLAT